MCRLYGYLSERPTRVECGLIAAQNSLLHQSQSDSRGLSNPDGWGMAYYVEGRPHRRRRVLPASEDDRFLATAHGIYTHALLAHVRLATVGDRRLANVHPFRAGRWVFAHNGTIPGFESIRRRMQAETEPALQRLRRGTTDSEMCFLWLMSRWRRVTEAESPGYRDQAILTKTVRDAVRQIAGWCRAETTEEPPGLNFVLTDGRNLVASRYGSSLYMLQRQELAECELCRTCHCPVCGGHSKRKHATPVPCRAFVVASEPVTGEDWQEVPDGSVVSADRDIRIGQITC